MSLCRCVSVPLSADVISQSNTDNEAIVAEPATQTHAASQGAATETKAARPATGGGGNLVWEENCLEKFRTANSGAIFPITFHDCGGIFPILFFGHQVQNLYPVLGGGV